MSREVDAPQPLVIATPEEAYGPQGFVTDPAWFEEKVVTDAATGKTKKILPEPNYTVSEASKFFFAQKPDWLRWRSKKTKENPDGFFVLDGEPLPDHRTDAEFRYYTLADIERMAHALAQNGGISGARLKHITTLIRTLCKMYGFID